MVKINVTSLITLVEHRIRIQKCVRKIQYLAEKLSINYHPKQISQKGPNKRLFTDCFEKLAQRSIRK